MKALQKMFDRVRGHFAEGGPLCAGRPLFDAMENFFFAPSTRTVAAPHVRDPLDVKRLMTMVILGLAPCAILSVYLFGLRALAMIAVSYIAGGTVEVLFAIVRKEEINEGFLVTGLLFPLTLPPAFPLWMVAAGVIFGVVIGKELFGGTGRNLFNPALVGRCSLALAYPRAISSHWVVPVASFPGRLGQWIDISDVDAITSATPLTMAKQGQFPAWSDMFLGNVAGSLGETSSAAVIAGGVFLLIVGVANWRTVVGLLGGFSLLSAILHWSDPSRFGLPASHLVAGGLLFGTFFMATDPVTSPITRLGKWAYGILIGVLTVLIRNLTGYVEGMMFAILLGNIAAPVLDEIVFHFHQRRLARER